MDETPDREAPQPTADESVLQAFAAGEIDALDAQGRFAQAEQPSEGKSSLPVPKPAPPPQPAATVVEPPAQRLGQYRGDRPRRGADFAWPKDVLDLMQPPRQDDLPIGPLVPSEDQQPHEQLAPPAQGAIPADQSQALPAAGPRRRRAGRRERLLILQLVLVAAGAWASVLLAWLLL